MIENTIPFEKIRRVLVVKLRHHGDVLLTTPVFSVLKSAMPQAEIDALVYAETEEMLSLNPDISQIHKIDRKWKRTGVLFSLRMEWRLACVLRSRQYDLIVHLTDHPRGASIARLAGIPWGVAKKVKGRGRWWKKAFSHLYETPRHALRHTVEINLDALRKLGIQPNEADKKLKLIAGELAENSINSRLIELGIDRGNFIHIHPGSRWFFKCWPAGKMAQLIDRLIQDGQKVILTAAPTQAELEIIDLIQKELSVPVPSLAGQLTLKELAALSARAKLFIGVDSAPMHIASAMQVPVLALFGPSGDKEWGPWMTVKHRVIVSQDYTCRPCGIDGCGGGKISDCLVRLPVEQVYLAAKELLIL